MSCSSRLLRSVMSLTTDTKLVIVPRESRIGVMVCSAQVLLAALLAIDQDTADHLPGEQAGPDLSIELGRVFPGLEHPRRLAQGFLRHVARGVLERRIDILDHAGPVRDEDGVSGLLHGVGEVPRPSVSPALLRHVVSHGVEQTGRALRGGRPEQAFVRAVRTAIAVFEGRGWRAGRESPHFGRCQSRVTSSSRSKMISLGRSL